MILTLPALRRILSQPVSHWSGKRRLIVSAVFLLAYVLSASVVAIGYAGLWHRPLSALQFGFGPLVANLMDHGRYIACQPEICFTAHRMPLAPYFLASLQFARDN